MKDDPLRKERKGMARIVSWDPWQTAEPAQRETAGAAAVAAGSSSRSGKDG
jgi:hypothetical protein